MGCEQSINEEAVSLFLRSADFPKIIRGVESYSYLFNSIVEESEGDVNLNISALGALATKYRPKEATFWYQQNFESLPTSQRNDPNNRSFSDDLVNALTRINELQNERVKENGQPMILNRAGQNDERFRTTPIEVRGALTFLSVITRGFLGANVSMKFHFMGNFFELILFHPTEVNEAFRDISTVEKICLSYFQNKNLFPNDEDRKKFVATFISNKVDLVDLEKTEEYGLTLLHAAILNRSLPLFKYFFDFDVIDVTATSFFGQDILEMLVCQDSNPNLQQRFASVRQLKTIQEEQHFRDEIFKEIASSGKLQDILRKYKQEPSRQVRLTEAAMRSTLNSCDLINEMLLSGVCGDVWNPSWSRTQNFVVNVLTACTDRSSGASRSEDEICKILQAALALPSCNAAAKSQLPPIQSIWRNLPSVVQLLTTNGIRVE